MDLNNIPLMTALKQRMSWLTEKQRVMSQNVANADTPGFRAMEMEEQDFSGLVDSLSKSGRRSSSVAATAMRKTDSRHLGGSTGSGAFKLNEIKGNEEKADGNSVVLEEEMMKIADAQMQYSMMVSLYKKNVTLLKVAMGKTGR